MFVFRVYDETETLTGYQSKHSMRSILRNIKAGGLETYLYYSVQRDEVYCKVRAPLPRLKQEADRCNLRLPLDPVALKNMAMMGIYDRGVQLVKPIKIVDEKHVTPLSPFEYIYGEYVNDDDEEGKRVAQLYTKYPPNQIPFSGVHRSSWAQWTQMPTERSRWRHSNMPACGALRPRLEPKHDSERGNEKRPRKVHSGHKRL